MGLARATNFPTYHDGSRSSLPRCWVIGSYFLYGLRGWTHIWPFLIAVLRAMPLKSRGECWDGQWASTAL